MRRFILYAVFVIFIIAGHLDAKVIYHDYPRICPRSNEFKVRINDDDVVVYHTSAGDFLSFESDSAVSVEVEWPKPIENISVLPRRLGIKPEISGHVLKFTLPEFEKVLIETEERKQLFIYANKIQKDKPDPYADGVRYFKSGQVYEVGTLRLQNNETLYIEGGAVVRGCLIATSAKNIRIEGTGVLDGGYYSNYNEHSHFVRFEDCQNVMINDIIMIEPPGWMVVLYHCKDVKIDNIKQISDGHGTDGIDIVTTHHVRINNCMLRNGDDCIVAKSFVSERYSEPTLNTHEGVNDILATGCSVQANGGGQAFEIGHELRIDPVRNIRFIDCDVLGVHGQGGVFGIHNCDGATVSDVRYENIRVDHYYNKLIDMRIIKSRWSREKRVGYVKNIVLKNIRVTNSIYNPGYSISLIGGYDDDHMVENVKIEDFYIDDKKITNTDQLDLFLKQTKHVVIK